MSAAAKTTVFPVAFTVTGRSHFPIDMLRYDRCVPATERDSGLIAYANDPRGPGDQVEVRLIAHSANRPGTPGAAPTVGRWRSFGWRVVEGAAS